jgi:hypothetical protein
MRRNRRRHVSAILRQGLEMLVLAGKKLSLRCSSEGGGDSRAKPQG